MRKKIFAASVIMLIITGAVLGVAYRQGVLPDFSMPAVPVLQPKGQIAEKQRDLMVFSTLIMLIVVVPVFVMLFFFAWKYRAGNTKATYAPDWDHSKAAETIWWGLPLVIIIVLAVVTVKSSHELDPYRPIASSKRAVQIQVVALQWKWLFLYPEQDIATVNYVQFPEDTPVEFTITADAPMNSFWIPQLGGQVYAMSGMSTKLFLEANAPGSYRGMSANISGQGFAGMNFTARSTTSEDFYRWMQVVKRAPFTLNAKEYAALAQPSETNPVSYYSAYDNGLYGTILAKYMSHGHASSSSAPSTKDVPSPFLNGHGHTEIEDTDCEGGNDCGGAL